MARYIFRIPVREMLERIDSYELSEWFVFLEIEQREQDKERKRQEAEAKAAQKPAAPKYF